MMPVRSASLIGILSSPVFTSSCAAFCAASAERAPLEVLDARLPAGVVALEDLPAPTRGALLLLATLEPRPTAGAAACYLAQHCL